jgi:hypothetical protein
MKLNFNYYQILIFILICFSSCDKGFDQLVEVPAAKPFVTCYLSNSADKIYAYYKTPISVNESGQYGNIEDATISIFNGQFSMQMLYDTIKNVYVLDTVLMPIQRGVNYEINITNSDGTTMYGQTVIPTYLVPPYEYSATHNSNKYLFTYKFTDPDPGETYYLFQFISKVPCQIIGCTDTVYYTLKSIAVRKKETEVSVNNAIVFTVDPNVYNFRRLGNSYGMICEAFSINKDMYNYFTSVDANLQIQSVNSSPAPVFSSFTVGNGIFGPVMAN